MRTEQVSILETIGETAGLPLGTRIATNHNKIFVLDFAFGREYWIEEGTLSPFYDCLVHWLPVIVLPPAIEEGPNA